MDEFDNFEIYDWAHKDYFFKKHDQNNKLDIYNHKVTNDAGLVNENSNLLTKDIVTINGHCSNLTKAHDTDERNGNTNNTITSTESLAEEPFLKLKDPPDINEILTTDEKLIKATPHNVSILNAACQKVLKEMEHILLNQLKRNRKEQEVVLNYLILNDKSKSYEGNKKTSIKCLGIPYFKDANGFPPPLNEDVIAKKRCNKLVPVDFISGSHIWKSKDSAMLIKAVTENSSTNGFLNPEAIDWLKISATSMDGKYSPAECKSKWILNLSPSINKSKWKFKEMNHLRELVEKYNNQNWDKIAEELGTNRSGFQCCVQYQTHKSPYGERWTKAEDNSLKQIIKQYKIKDYIPWKKVVWNFEGRSLRQCHERFAYHLQNIKKGNFTSEEDYVLIYLYSKLKSFKEVAKYFPNRVCTQIRARYEYLVKLTMPEFSKEEDELLTQLMMKYPRNWEKISEHFKDRSKLQCRGRWAAIQKHISLKNEISSESDAESSEEVANLEISKQKPNNNEIKDKIETTIINQKFNHFSKHETKQVCQKKFTKQYTKLLDYFKCGYKFLLGPKPRFPSQLEEMNKLCNKLKITMRSLCITSTARLNAFNIDLLDNNCEFDIEDLGVLRAIKNNDKEENIGNVEGGHKILPPNYITLIGVRSLMLGASSIKNLPNYYKCANQTDHRIDESDRILYSDAKKLFKSRLKTLFAFPLFLSNVSSEAVEVVHVPPKKVKRNKPLSLRRRRNHGKKMLELREKLKLSLDKKLLQTDNNAEVGITNNHEVSNLDKNKKKCKNNLIEENCSVIKKNYVASVESNRKKIGRPRKLESKIVENGGSDAKKPRLEC